MYDMRALNTIRKEPGSPKEKRTILSKLIDRSRQTACHNCGNFSCACNDATEYPFFKISQDETKFCPLQS